MRGLGVDFQLARVRFLESRGVGLRLQSIFGSAAVASRRANGSLMTVINIGPATRGKLYATQRMPPDFPEINHRSALIEINRGYDVDCRDVSLYDESLRVYWKFEICNQISFN